MRCLNKCISPFTLFSAAYARDTIRAVNGNAIYLAEKTLGGISRATRDQAESLEA